LTKEQMKNVKGGGDWAFCEVYHTYPTNPALHEQTFQIYCGLGVSTWDCAMEVQNYCSYGPNQCELPDFAHCSIMWESWN